MPRCNTYGAGFSKLLNDTKRLISRKSRDAFMKRDYGIMQRLGRKMMGDRNGAEPFEEIYHLNSADRGVIENVATGDKTTATEIQQGLNCLGQLVDMETQGGNAHDALCGSSYRGNFSVGTDRFFPSFYKYEFRMPPICVDAMDTSPDEVVGTINAILKDGPKMVRNNLDYLMQDLLLIRGTGNTSIAENVTFGRDVNLTNGEFPYDAQGNFSHRFVKRIQQIVQADPENLSKNFVVRGPERDLQAAIAFDQSLYNIDRRSHGNELPEAYRLESGQMYDGIVYIFEKTPEYVGVNADVNGKITSYERPLGYYNQAGNVYGLVARANYDLYRGCRIRCADGEERDKRVIIKWYLEESVSYVPFMAKRRVKTSGQEEIKSNVYNDPHDFKSYWIKEHAVQTPENCVNDRGQYQQMGLRVVFGLYNRPDIIDHGHILALPFNDEIILQNAPCPETTTVPATCAIEPADRGDALSNGCEPCEGSGPTQPAGQGENPDGTSLVAARLQDINGDIGTVSVADDGTLTVEIFNTTPDLREVNLVIAANDGVAVNGTEYTFADTPVVLPAGDATAQTVTIPVIDLPAGYNGDFTIYVSSSDVGDFSDIAPITYNISAL